jgi:hypothetical protein
MSRRSIVLPQKDKERFYLRNCLIGKKVNEAFEPHNKKTQKEIQQRGGGGTLSKMF